MLYGMVSYFAKLTGEDILLYLNKIESLVLAPYRRSDCKCYKMFTFFLPYITTARTTDMKKLRHCQSAYVQ